MALDVDDLGSVTGTHSRAAGVVDECIDHTRSLFLFIFLSYPLDSDVHERILVSGPLVLPNMDRSGYE